jgi:hypothetical protein
MRQPAFIVATLTGSLLFGASVAGALRAPGLDATGLAANAPAQGSLASQAAAPQAAALAAAIEAQFPGHAVQVALDAPAVAEAGAAQQEVQALARVRIDGSAPMLVRATALYDDASRSIDAPSLWFEGTGAQGVSADLRRALAAAAARRLGAEFAAQAPALALADAEAVRVGGRYLRLVARGTADFGPEGRSATTVEALYDPRSGEWLRLDYSLGADPAEADPGAAFAYAGS